MNVRKEPKKPLVYFCFDKGSYHLHKVSIKPV